MVMWKLKSCPRCGGDFYIDKDADGWYEQCLQCAYRRELKPLVESKQPAPEETEVALAGDTRYHKKHLPKEKRG
jgi:DNA-directed RNA polymerase subunit RPC12/RpoP